MSTLIKKGFLSDKCEPSFYPHMSAAERWLEVRRRLELDDEEVESRGAWLPRYEEGININDLSELSEDVDDAAGHLCEEHGKRGCDASCPLSRMPLYVNGTKVCFHFARDGICVTKPNHPCGFAHVVVDEYGIWYALTSTVWTLKADVQRHSARSIQHAACRLGKEKDVRKTREREEVSKDLDRVMSLTVVRRVEMGDAEAEDAALQEFKRRGVNPTHKHNNQSHSRR